MKYWEMTNQKIIEYYLEILQQMKASLDEGQHEKQESEITIPIRFPSDDSISHKVEMTGPLNYYEHRNFLISGEITEAEIRINTDTKKVLEIISAKKIRYLDTVHSSGDETTHKVESMESISIELTQAQEKYDILRQKIDELIKRLTELREKASEVIQLGENSPKFFISKDGTYSYITKPSVSLPFGDDIEIAESDLFLADRLTIEHMLMDNEGAFEIDEGTIIVDKIPQKLFTVIKHFSGNSERRDFDIKLWSDEEIRVTSQIYDLPDTELEELAASVREYDSNVEAEYKKEDDAISSKMKELYSSSTPYDDTKEYIELKRKKMPDDEYDKMKEELDGLKPEQGLGAIVEFFTRKVESRRKELTEVIREQEDIRCQLEAIDKKRATYESYQSERFNLRMKNIDNTGTKARIEASSLQSVCADRILEMNEMYERDVLEINKGKSRSE